MTQVNFNVFDHWNWNHIWQLVNRELRIKLPPLKANNDVYLWLKQRGEEVDQVDVLEQNKR